MIITLRVLSAGKMEGKKIEVTHELLVGRDPSCNLRPSSALISGKHCLICYRGGEAVVEDLNSTNGTMVNGYRIEGLHALKQGDRLEIGPLAFMVESAAAISAKPQSEDDVAADLLLAMGNEPPPMGSTIMMSAARQQPPDSEPPPSSPKAESPTPQETASNTSTAAAKILGKFSRRR